MSVRIGFGLLVLLALLGGAFEAALACQTPRYSRDITDDKFVVEAERKIVAATHAQIGGSNITYDELLTAYAEYKLARQGIRATAKADDDHFKAINRFSTFSNRTTIAANRMSVFRKVPATSLHAHDANSMFWNARERFRVQGLDKAFTIMTDGFSRAWGACK